jgi:outer membrane PBP1 activator LpoA protein
MGIRVFLGCCIAVFVLASCSNTPAPTSKAKIKQPKVKQLLVDKNSRYYLDQARILFEKNNDPHERNSQLLKAAELLQSEQQPAQSIKLLQVLLPEVQNSQQLSLTLLYLAEGYSALPDNNAVVISKILKRIDISQVPVARLALIQSDLFTNQKKWLNAAATLLNTDLEANLKSKKIWLALEHLSLSQLEKARFSHPQLSPWIQLAVITQRHALSPIPLRQQIASWQNNNMGHPLQQKLPAKLLQAIEQPTIEAKRIAVLLPLTGRLASQGKVLKDGFLTAYLQDQQKLVTLELDDQKEMLDSIEEKTFREVRFFDSALKNAAELNALVANYDVIVGPLLKDKIQRLSEILPDDKVLLALNRVDSISTNELTNDAQETSAKSTKEHYYFSLAPEDEAEQLAKHIHNKQLSRPIIFADNNNVTKRMAQAFIQQWQTVQGVNTPELRIFKNNKEMRDSVAAMLDVEQSKNRIKKIERIADVEVFGKQRNRRDIDAIVLFANPEQTALLNPIIEASLSSFAEISLSVFATSRSYSQNQTEGNLRDLRNLTFSDMPWLLPEHEWQNLAAQFSQLWPQRQDSLARLFAMGYDAYGFIPQLRQLKTLPQLTSQGLTGQINVETSGIIRRSLPWAKITKEKVSLLGMD